MKMSTAIALLILGGHLVTCSEGPLWQKYVNVVCPSPDGLGLIEVLVHPVMTSVTISCGDGALEIPRLFQFAISLEETGKGYVCPMQNIGGGEYILHATPYADKTALTEKLTIKCVRDLSWTPPLTTTRDPSMTEPPKPENPWRDFLNITCPPPGELGNVIVTDARVKTATMKCGGSVYARVPIKTFKPIAVAIDRGLDACRMQDLGRGEFAFYLTPQDRFGNDLADQLFVNCTYPGTYDHPTIHLSAQCPPVSSQSAVVTLTADVPAYAKARCRHGPGQFRTTDGVHYYLTGTFDQSNRGADCLFHQKKGSNTFTVDIEVGWGEKHGAALTNSQVKTISCAFDDHGDALSGNETMGNWFLSPHEIQTLLGSHSTTEFTLKVVDIFDNEIETDHVSIGRKIRLMATNTSGPVAGFRAVSCFAKNSETSFAILRAGCGDGLLLHKTQGFHTEGNAVFSPYFEAFKLRGNGGLRFECNFTVCTSECDGSSCPNERKRRSPFSHRLL